MGRVLSNNTTLQYAIELTETDPNLIGVLPGEDGQSGTPTWFELEPIPVSRPVENVDEQ